MFMSRKRTKDEGGRKERKGKEDGIYLESHFFFFSNKLPKTKNFVLKRGFPRVPCKEGGGRNVKTGIL